MPDIYYQDGNTRRKVKGIQYVDGSVVRTIQKVYYQDETDTRLVYNADDIAPVIMLNGVTPLVINQHSSYIEQGATSDDGSLVDITGSVNTAVIGIYNITYTATDAAGNTGTAVRVVQVIDSAPPLITLVGYIFLYINQGSAFVDPGYSTDDGSLVVVTTNLNINVPATYTVYYNSTDAGGNVAIQRVRYVTVQDVTPPIITLLGANPYNFDFGYGTYVEPGANVDDGSPLHITGASVATINASIGTYTRRYRSTDGSGNAATFRTRTINHIQSVTISGVIAQWHATSTVTPSDIELIWRRHGVEVARIILSLSHANGLTVVQSHPDVVTELTVTAFATTVGYLINCTHNPSGAHTNQIGVVITGEDSTTPPVDPPDTTTTVSGVIDTWISNLVQPNPPDATLIWSSNGTEVARVILSLDASGVSVVQSHPDVTTTTTTTTTRATGDGAITDVTDTHTTVLTHTPSGLIVTQIGISIFMLMRTNKYLCIF